MVVVQPDWMAARPTELPVWSMFAIGGHGSGGSMCLEMSSLGSVSVSRTKCARSSVLCHCTQWIEPLQPASQTVSGSLQTALGAHFACFCTSILPTTCLVPSGLASVGVISLCPTFCPTLVCDLYFFCFCFTPFLVRTFYALQFPASLI